MFTFCTIRSTRQIRLGQSADARARYIAMYSSQKPEAIVPLLKQAIDNANKTCMSPSTKDIECIIKWDEVDELTKAYRKAVEHVKLSDEAEQEQVQEEMTFLGKTYKYPPQKNANSWDVLM